MIPKNKDYDKKILRVVSMLNKLDSEGKVSTRRLAEEFNVTPRTVQRDLDCLNRAGFPLVSVEKGIHSFMDGFSLKRAALSGEDASLLAFLGEIAQSLGNDFEDSFRRILRKVLARDVESPFYMKIPEGVKLGEGFPFVKDLKRAIEDNKKAEILYEAEEGGKQLKVHPFKMMYFDGSWYLLARVDGKGWIIKLRIEKIK